MTPSAVLIAHAAIAIVQLAAAALLANRIARFDVRQRYALAIGATS